MRESNPDKPSKTFKESATLKYLLSIDQRPKYYPRRSSIIRKSCFKFHRKTSKNEFAAGDEIFPQKCSNSVGLRRFIVSRWFFFAKRRNFFSVLSENSRNVYSRLKRNRLREKRTKLTVTYISFHFVSLTLSRTLSHLTPTRTLSLSHASNALFLRPDYDVFDIIFSRNDPFSCFDNFLIASEKKKKLKISILSLSWHSIKIESAFANVSIFVLVQWPSLFRHQKNAQFSATVLRMAPFEGLIS